LAIVKTSGLLEMNEIVRPEVMLCPAASRAVAEKLSRLPISIELRLAGLKVTDAGTVGGFGALLELVLPQATSIERDNIRMTTHTTGLHRPMNPPRASVNALRERVCSGKL
jgi:hypothetical protein